MPRTHAERRRQLLEKLLTQVRSYHQCKRHYERTKTHDMVRLMVQADQAVIRTLGEIERTEALARGENPSQAMMFGG